MNNAQRNGKLIWRIGSGSMAAGSLSLKGIYNLHTAMDKIRHIPSCHRQPVISRTRCNHGVLYLYSKTRVTNFTEERPPNQGYIQGSIQAKYPTTQPPKPNLQVGSSLALRHFPNTVPDFSHHNGISDALLNISLKPVYRLFNTLQFGRFLKQVGIYKILHQKEMALRSATVSFWSIAENQSFSGQAFNQSTKSAFDPGETSCSSAKTK